ncbi:LacI family DNA-binding transcriptional regulator [Croceivirga sp. JEA036]|uniref:LacI family DNA-binding transcriptional regulator n=1 Tax=Croceivirga sp. JEA036 TaxID=2721162 RepID=UPI0014387C23|nr:LacI family DNA-binding transcriptional regulator [Croceivirga sp. JEA036]NJB36478.1 LacI family transcriptional regulator [Croceivirga sp. JEA036]
MAGIKEISKMTGLSLATVSRVFNDSNLVSAKTKRKVLKAAEQLNYRHNRIAAALRSGKSMTIGVLVPEINNYFFGNVINGIEKKLVANGYSTIITQSHESAEIEKLALESLLKLNVDGILVSTSKNTIDFSVFENLQKEGTPIVFFDRKPALDNASVVLLDDFKGGQIATQHLIDAGCTALLHIAGEDNVSIFKKRKEGFENTIKESMPPISYHDSISLSFNVDQDTKLLKQILKEHPYIDGVFCHGDKYGVHTMNILRLLGYSIPEQIKIIGFGNNDYTHFTHPRLSSIDQKCDEMGTLAVEVLLDNLEKNNVIHSQHILLPKLMERESS